MPENPTIRIRSRCKLDQNSVVKLLNSYRQLPQTSVEGLRSPFQVSQIKARVQSFKEEKAKPVKQSFPTIQLSYSVAVDQILKTTLDPKAQLTSIMSQQSLKVQRQKSTQDVNIAKVQTTPSSVIATQKRLRKYNIGISARSYVVYDVKTRQIVLQRKSHKKLEIASLTKIMTFFTCLQLLSTMAIDPKKMRVKVSKLAADTIGTSADLKHRDILTVHDLFYGLMLPSGNDAAICLAQAFGVVLFSKTRGHQMIDIEQLSAEGFFFNANERIHESPVEYFIQEMNRQARLLNMMNTMFASSHGMNNRYNVSCTADLAILCHHAMNLEQFVHVVGQKDYHTQAKLKSYSWKNTNKLLDRGYMGIKTGVTDHAGPCLASAYKNETDHLIVILLKCSSLNSRFDETIRLTEYAKRKLNQ